MPVAVFLGSFWPREGGSERQLRQLGSSFAERGHPLLIFTQSVPGVPRNETIDHCTVSRVGRPSLKFGLGKISYVGAATIQALWRRDVNGVISTQLGAASMAAGIVARARRQPHIVRLTGGGAGTPNGTELASKLASRAGRAWVRFILGYGRVVLAAPAFHLIDDAERRLNKSIPTLVIPNAVGPVMEPAEQRRSVIWYYRSGPAKNLSAFLSVARLLPEVDFKVIGSAEFDSNLANVRSLGWIAEPEALLASASALLSTSLAEGSPNMCLQAIAQGTPVVGIENPGLREVQEMGGTLVHLSPAPSPEHLANILAKILANGPTMDRRVVMPSMGETADRWIEALDLKRQEE